jgi:hypothetical protein
VQFGIAPNCRPAPGPSLSLLAAPGADTEEASERRYLARRRYRGRPLVCSLPRGERPGSLTAQAIVMRSTGWVSPGRALLVRVREADGGRTHTFLAHVRRVMHRPGGACLIGCTFTPPLEEHELTALVQFLDER